MRIIRKLEKVMYKTKQRELIMNYLNKHQDKLFCAEDISLALRNQNISPSAVYRNLAELKNMGKLRQTTQRGSRKIFYQFLDNNNCKGHIHLSCINCGHTSHLDDSAAKLITQKVKLAENFDIDKDDTVIYGICNNCKEKTK